jgi:ribosomal protein S18 acetylase RimI-like enzyme
MSTQAVAIRRLGRADLSEAVDVLCESFFDYPVMRFVLGDSTDYADHLRRLVSFFVEARLYRDEVLLGIDDAQGLTAVALISYPDDRASPPAIAEIRERVWAILGAEARSRYEVFGTAAAPLEIEVPHIHLNMIGVRTRSKGRGLGRALLDAVHGLSAEDSASTGVTLTTELPGNVSLYEYFGYEIVGSVDVGGALTSWGFFRPDRSEPEA